MIFLIDGGIRIIGYTYSGYYHHETLMMAVIAIPVLLFGLYLGHHLHLNISQVGFNRVISVILMMSGIALLFRQ